ncbi:MAG: GrpB family protein [Bacteroidales bacterium]|nr:GrpB family protein [Bacteroidales bacterium]
MPQKLNKLNIEELGTLFPVIISDPNPDWGKIYKSEKSKIEKTLGKHNILKIEHIGSTAVPGLKAKPTIDILLEILDGTSKNLIITKLKQLDYDYIPRPDNPPPHMMFARGYTIHGFSGQAFHVHIRYSGDWDEIYFRDYLRSRPGIAKEYEGLKILLSAKYKNDREAYTNNKTEFIKRISGLARKEKNQYD